MTPSERLTGPLDDVIVHGDAQPMLDYEGELTFILSKDAKDVKEEDALDYVLGYTVGNDVSARSLIPIEISGNQMGYSKSFDTVNGETRQDTSTRAMTFSVKQLIAYASKNRTLKKGTVFMTGTPDGVGWFSDGLLKDGDVVEVEVSEVGSISNKMTFK
ncbi:hypothetical protein Neosp_015243 [[Neocosmospora] mangrovei]